MIAEQRHIGAMDIQITIPDSFAALAASRGHTVQSYIAHMIAEALAEQEINAEMAAFRKNVTGVDNTIFISAKVPGNHEPRIKVAIDPPTHLDRSGKNASIAIGDGRVLDGDIRAKVLSQVRNFIGLNGAVLMDYWEQRIDDDQLRQRLKSI